MDNADLDMKRVMTYLFTGLLGVFLCGLQPGVKASDTAK